MNIGHWVPVRENFQSSTPPAPERCEGGFDVQAKPMINKMIADEIRVLLKLEPSRHVQVRARNFHE